MDDFRGFGDGIEAELAREDEPAIEAPPEIGTDERRMHVRAYNYWVSLLDGRPYPSIQDVNPEVLGDFGPHSILLDFSASSDNPAIPFIGRALREECGIEGAIGFIDEVPSRSLISRLTDHYLQIIANRAPIGFEAEFQGSRGNNTMYRGILMPLSSDGSQIDFIYGVINWKEVADHRTTADLVGAMSRAAAAAPFVEAGPIWADGPNSEPLDEQAFPLPSAAFDDVLELGVGATLDDDQPGFEFTLDADAGLADRLHLARETADALKGADARSRAALYRALGHAYDFALAAEAQPDDYAEILEDAGLKAQDRAPMTPIVKLIFGADYDKTRLTEFAAALSYGRREDVAAGGLPALIEGFAGGLKGIVQAERSARRPTPKPDRGAAARASLRAGRPLGYVDAPPGDTGEEFVLLVGRREGDGRLAVVAPVEAGKALIEQALCKAVV